jgi:hypothetical protein
MGKSAHKQVVSMVVQLRRTDDVATVGCRCNGNPQDQPIALLHPYDLVHIMVQES